MVGNNDSFKNMSSEHLLDSLIEKAIDAKASFIHIEPRNLEVLIRYRIDGSLVEIDKFSKDELDNLTNRLKELANLESHIKEMPQDGKFNISFKDHSYMLRTTIIPTIDGEKVSINILKTNNTPPSLQELGYWGTGLKNITNSLSHSRGVILLTGPSGSGKSLSLISMLSNVADPHLKIATIEDPIEYIFPRANQIQVNHKANISFVSGLKTIELQDYDIIMVSELRDSETTKLVFHYGDKNNLLLSSLNTNSISEALDRLENNDVDIHEIAHLLKIISSQKLVRRLCAKCREIYEPSKATLALIENIYKLSNPKNMKNIHRLESIYLQETTSDKKISLRSLNSSETKIKKLYKANRDGCEECNHSGYKGMVGLFEIINISESIQKLLLSLASPKVLLDRATIEGTITILTDGLIKALRGLTSIEEIFSIYQEYI